MPAASDPTAGPLTPAGPTIGENVVALKVLPFAPALDARQLQRFQNEARAAAHLNHVNIVPIYAVGCERGVHYYAMQYIEGQSLSALIEDLQQIEERATLQSEGRSDDAFVLASKLASEQLASAGCSTLPMPTNERERSEESRSSGETAIPLSPAATG